MKLLTLIILSLFSVTAFTHSGHGESSVFAHALDHTLWILAGVILLIGVVMLKRRQ